MYGLTEVQKHSSGLSSGREQDSEGDEADRGLSLQRPRHMATQEDVEQYGWCVDHDPDFALSVRATLSAEDRRGLPPLAAACGDAASSASNGDATAPAAGRVGGPDRYAPSADHRSGTVPTRCVREYRAMCCRVGRTYLPTARWAQFGAPDV